MTASEGEREPTVGDVLAAIAALDAKMTDRFGQVDAALESLAGMAYTHERQLRELSVRADRLRAHVNGRFDRVDAALRQVRGDSAEIKADVALLESSVEETRETVQRHLEDPGAHGHAA